MEMCQILQQAFVVLCVFQVVSVSGQPCVYEGCSCYSTEIDCVSRSLTRLPEISPTVDNYTMLNLADNAIIDVPTGSLPSNLIAIYLTENPITTIAETAFDGSASTLQTLGLSNALFTRIPDAFSHLKSLKELNMQDLNITDWNEEAMKNIGQTLTSLDLENVGFTSWPSWLQYFSYLSTLTVSRCSISSIPDDALDSLSSSLVYLTLTSNKLTQVPKALLKLTSLLQLYLQENQIVDVTWLPSNSRLTLLSLHNNLIWDSNQLSHALRPFADVLEDFDITDNRLTSIPNVTFLSKINYFDFSSNRITDANSGAVSATVTSIDLYRNFLPAIPRVLKTLDFVSMLTLSYNSIRQIRESDFPLSATMVELDNNLITELTDNSFPANSAITNLQLNNNPIVTVSSKAFNNLGRLTYLTLQGTRLSRLPLALGSLASLYTLDMTDISTLVCTCEEKSLARWVLSLETYYVMGSCGLMDIREFFSELSPSCPS